MMLLRLAGDLVSVRGDPPGIVWENWQKYKGQFEFEALGKEVKFIELLLLTIWAHAFSHPKRTAWVGPYANPRN